MKLLDNVTFQMQRLQLMETRVLIFQDGGSQLELKIANMTKLNAIERSVKPA